MDVEDKKSYINRYAERYLRFGHDPRTLGWGPDRHKQQLRFQALKEIGDLAGKTVLDVGCGFGDFYGFLKQHSLNVAYTGLDIVAVLLEKARTLWPETTFLEYDFLSDSELDLKADYVFASGVFNAKVITLGGNENYIEAMMAKMYAISNVAVYVDFLSNQVDYQHEIAYHADPGRMLRMASSLSRRLCLRHDYLPYEFCIYLYKDDAIDGTLYQSDVKLYRTKNNL